MGVVVDSAHQEPVGADEQEPLDRGPLEVFAVGAAVAHAVDERGAEQAADRPRGADAVVDEGEARQEAGDPGDDEDREETGVAVRVGDERAELEQGPRVEGDVQGTAVQEASGDETPPLAPLHERTKEGAESDQRAAARREAAEARALDVAESLRGEHRRQVEDDQEQRQRLGQGLFVVEDPVQDGTPAEQRRKEPAALGTAPLAAVDERAAASAGLDGGHAGSSPGAASRGGIPALSRPRKGASVAVRRRAPEPTVVPPASNR